MKLPGNISASDRFTRTVFGIIMVAAFFFEWGKYAVAVMGILFLISAAFGFCLTCWAYNQIFGCKTCNIKS